MNAHEQAVNEAKEIECPDDDPLNRRHVICANTREQIVKALEAHLVRIEELEIRLAEYEFSSNPNKAACSIKDYYEIKKSLDLWISQCRVWEEREKKHNMEVTKVEEENQSLKESLKGVVESISETIRLLGLTDQEPEDYFLTCDDIMEMLDDARAALKSKFPSLFGEK